MSCGKYLQCHSPPMMMQLLQIRKGASSNAIISASQAVDGRLAGVMLTHGDAYALYTSYNSAEQRAIRNTATLEKLSVGATVVEGSLISLAARSGRRSELDRNSFVSTCRVNCGCAPLARMVEQDSEFARIELGNRHAGPLTPEELYDVVRRHVGGCILVYSAFRCSFAPNSHARKKTRGEAPAVSQSRGNGDLSHADVCKLLIAHDRDINQRHAAATLAFKFLPDSALADTLLMATKTWQSQRKPGQAHEFGSCGTAVGTVLCQKLLEHGTAHHKQRDTALLQALDSFMANPIPEHVCGEVAHCSIRLSKKGDSAILEVRFHIASVLMPHLHVIRGYILAMDGELLVPRPVGSLLRHCVGS